MSGNVAVTQTVAITFPCTLEDVEAFVTACHALGVSNTQKLGLKVSPGYSDPRESSPASATVTGTA